jgi:hypothetical protein
MTDDFYFHGEIDRKEFLGNVGSSFCRKAKENIDGLINLFLGEDLVLLTETNEVSVRSRHERSYFEDKMYCLTNPKEVSISYFAREPNRYFPHPEGNDIDIGVRIDASGLVYAPSSIANVLRRDRLGRGKFSIMMDADIFSNGKFENNKYSTQIRRAIYLPIEISSRTEDIERVLKNVHWEGGISRDEGFFDKVLKSFNKYEKNKKPFISFQINR